MERRRRGAVQRPDRRTKSLSDTVCVCVYKGFLLLFFFFIKKTSTEHINCPTKLTNERARRRGDNLISYTNTSTLRYFILSDDTVSRHARTLRCPRVKSRPRTINPTHTNRKKIFRNYIYRPSGDYRRRFGPDTVARTTTEYCNRRLSFIPIEITHACTRFIILFERI